MRAERREMIARGAIPAYCVVGISLLATIGLCLATGFSITIEALTLFWLWPFLCLAGMLARRIHFNRIGDALEGIGLFYGVGLMLLYAHFPLAAISGPYFDETLAKWDAALGLDWPAYTAVIAPYTKWLIPFYGSLKWQPALLAIGLVVAKQPDRIWTFALACALGSATAALFFPIFPAKGVYLYHDVVANYPELVKQGTWQFHTTIEHFRNGGRVISTEWFDGLVSFPSIHAMVAVQWTVAAWTVRWLRWPFLLLNTGLLVATPVIGAHYFVDVFAGAALGIFAIVIALIVRRRFSAVKSTQ